MKKCYFVIYIFLSFLLQNCSLTKPISPNRNRHNTAPVRSQVIIKNKVAPRTIYTGNVPAGTVATFAESLQGVPYTWGSASVEKGFDCSGFLYYVFNHFNIKVPRTSVEYTNAGKDVLTENCKRGDIILFTGSDANSGVVGHMGMITKNNHGEIEFIHCASGEGIGVIVSRLSGYYIPRFVKVISFFKV